MTSLVQRIRRTISGFLALAVVAGGTAMATPAIAVPEGAGATTSVHDLRTNALTDPLGIDADAPRMSWKLEGERRGIEQRAWQVRVATSTEALAQPDVWDSGKVDGRDSVDVRYGGPALASHTGYAWSVRVWDDLGAVSEWSEPATFETALLDDADWQAQWISEPEQRLGDEWTDYTVEFTASDIRGALGVYLRGEDTEHAYMWQLSQSENALRPHIKQGGYRVLAPAAFPAGFDWAASHSYTMTVDGSTITTSVDGTVVDERTDTTFAGPGLVGFRTSGGESGLVHDITVTSADGEVLVDTGFPSGDTTFTGGTVVADGLRLGSPDFEAWVRSDDPVPLLRDEFAVEDKPIASARIYAAARGVYRLSLNGERVGDHELAPGMTDYRQRIQYQTYDVTDLVRAGANAWGGELADGWWSGRIGFTGGENYGTRNALMAQLRVEYADGTEQVVSTDDGWTTRPGPRLAADLLDGERYDARRAAEIGKWTDPEHESSGWQPVEVLDSGTDLLEPQDDQPVRVTQELAAKAIASPKDGVYLFDLGQNMVGRARVTLTGAPGETARLRFAEVLNPDGSIYTANLRSAKATDYYTFATDEPETYESAFTFHGFRYVEVTGVGEAPEAADIVGVVLGTDGAPTGTLDTSSELVDQLHSNITWGQRGNFLSIPTDTPARDERLGWTGDINVFARTAVYTMDSQAFLSKWLQDLRDAQRSDGALPGIAPVIPGRFDGGYAPAGWADAGVHVPWTLWQAYGDTQVITDNYDMMTRYVGYLRSTSQGFIRTEGGYLDWLHLDDPTSADVIDTAFFAKSVRELADMAAAIGEADDAAEYRDLYEDIRQAYIGAFVSADGTVKGDSQTSYILTVTNGLVPDDRRDAVATQFVETLERRDWHLSTGFLGVDGLLPALSTIGRTDVAYRLLLNEDYPSWGYEIGRGATTIWERWNSIMPDGSFGPVEMNSFNHYAYGAVGEWMYRTMAGISALEPGYSRVLIAPEPGEGVTSSDASLETPYGAVRSAWQTTDAGLRLDVTVPPNASAEVRLPASTHWAVREGGRPAGDANGVTFLTEADGVASFEVGSGTYSFTIDEGLGRVGLARESGAAFAATVADLIGSGAVSGDATAYLGDQADELELELGKSWDAAASGDTARALDLVHRALKRAMGLRDWVARQAQEGAIGDDVAGSLAANLDALVSELSAASATFLGASVALQPAGDGWLPGTTGRVDLVISNTGDEALNKVASDLTVPEGWSAVPAGTRPDSVPAGGAVTHSYDVTVVSDAEPGPVALVGSAAWKFQSSTARVPVTGTIEVEPAVVVTGLEVPADADPGQVLRVGAELQNRGAAPQTGTLEIGLPDGWDAVAAQEWSLEPGASMTVEAEVTVPLSITEGAAAIVASVGDTADERAEAAVDVRLPNPPAGIIDHVDLGNATSEGAHALTASPASGTNVEAGLTRRYTNVQQPGGWFEHDLMVVPGEPFLLRVIETYDKAATKTYDVFVDGELVHARAYPRTGTGQGTVTYQFVVDLPAATADGVVRVRWQDDATEYDPSIADVWSTTLP
ncbi:family 78 glycoside hydrolase catalytic domain [Agromyces bauzanensis]